MLLQWVNIFFFPSWPECIRQILHSFYLFRRYTSAFWKLPGGGITILDFIVSKWFGVRGSKSSGSLDGTVRGRLLMIHSTSVGRVLKDSSWRARPCSRNTADKMERTERICLSHIPPMWVLFPLNVGLVFSAKTFLNYAVIHLIQSFL